MCAPAGATPPAATSDNAVRGRRRHCYRGRSATIRPTPWGWPALTERDGTPVPGLTVPVVTRQLTWRVLGPLKGRAKSVLDWAGLRGEPPQTFHDAGITYFVTGRTVRPPRPAGRRRWRPAPAQPGVHRRTVPPRRPRRGPGHAAALRPPARHQPAPHRPAGHRRRRRPPHTATVLRMLNQIRQRLANDHLAVDVVFPAAGMPADRRRPTRTTVLGGLRVPVRRAAPAAGRCDTTMLLIRTHV